MGGSFLLPIENQLLQDVVASIITASVALGSLSFFDELAKRNVFEQKVNRKLAHITIGLLFMLFWPLFSNGYLAPYLAALAPTISGLRVLAVGLGIVTNRALVKSLSREGDFRELKKGPFYYAVTIAAATAFLWRNSPVAPVIIANLCAGDGFADLVGRRFGKSKLPYNNDKSYVGSVAMFIMGSLFSVGYLLYFSYFGYLEMTTKLVIGCMIVSLISTLVESLSISTQLDDNFTIPFTCYIVGSLLL